MEPTIEQDQPLSNPVGHAGMVAVVGRANVGKSTLINHLLQEKISIVTPIAQTTRNTIRGVLTEPRGQLVFLDTPGVHKAPHELGKVMNKMARASVEGVDVILLVLDASTPPRQEDEGWIRRILREEAACFVALNKFDQGDPYAQTYRKLWKDSAAELDIQKEATWLSTSAEEGTGTDELLAALFTQMPVGPYLFPEEVLTDFPRKLAMADVIREKVIVRLHEELPHSIAVSVDRIDEEEDTWKIHAYIFVRKYSHKGIVIGQKGRLLRSAKRAAEKDLSEIYEKNISLKLWVKIEKDWPKNFWFLKRLGYVP